MDPSQDEFARYHSAVRYLESLGNIFHGYRKTDLQSHPHPEMFLERMQDFLDQLGNPERGFKYVHITGTAGKGSVSSSVHAALLMAGKRVGLFTSPFTVSTIEKIQVGSKYIDPLVFAYITERLKPHIDEAMLKNRHGAPSYFEMMLAIALIYFKIEKCEYAVLEVGLGGRYDATNIIKEPVITAVTNIGLDHTNILGTTRRLIAKDKAGIIKKGSVFFTSEEDPKIRDIFEAECAKTGAEYNALDVKGLGHDSRNRLLAGAICAKLGIIKSPSDMKTEAMMPARFEMIEKRPIVIIDGAHNPSKMKSTIFNLSRLKYKKLSLIIAVSADKDWKTMLKSIVPEAHAIYATRFSMPERQAVDPRALFEESKKHMRKTSSIRLYSDPVQAYADARKNLASDDALLVTGSFYLAGDIRKIYCPEEEILRQRSSKIRPDR
jgi:dihydrofolate synthase/folylpolyglutamate synthase